MKTKSINSRAELQAQLDALSDDEFRRVVNFGLLSHKARMCGDPVDTKFVKHWEVGYITLAAPCAYDPKLTRKKAIDAAPPAQKKKLERQFEREREAFKLQCL